MSIHPDDQLIFVRLSIHSDLCLPQPLFQQSAEYPCHIWSETVSRSKGWVNWGERERPEPNRGRSSRTEPSASLDSPVKAITLPHACTTSVTRCGVSKPADAFCTVHLRGNNDIKAIGVPIYFSRQGRLHCHLLFSAQLTAESPGPVSISAAVSPVGRRQLWPKPKQ